MRLLDERKIARRYCKLKDEALDHTVWRASFERGQWICHKTDCVMVNKSSSIMPRVLGSNMSRVWSEDKNENSK